MSPRQHGPQIFPGVRDARREETPEPLDPAAEEAPGRAERSSPESREDGSRPPDAPTAEGEE